MPYKRSYHRRRRFYPKRKRLAPSTYKAVKAVATKAVKQWTPLKQIRQVPPTSQFLTNGTVAQRCAAYNLTSIAQGNQMNQRVGSKIYVTGVKIDIYCVNNSATSIVTGKQFRW